jgi:DSBA-like thioredoxin domain
MTVSFSVTWDYRCPFARNAHEHVLSGLAAGADWNVHFLAFSLGQVHVEDGQPNVWEKPEQDGGILALQAGVVVRDHFADQFQGVHRSLFAARHDHALQLDDWDVIAGVLNDQGVEAKTVRAHIDSGEALATVRDEHERFVASHRVWGVPTFIAGDQAVFVRLMDRSPLGADSEASMRTVERTVDLVSGWTELNEFKHTSIPR